MEGPASHHSSPVGRDIIPESLGDNDAIPPDVRETADDQGSKYAAGTSCNIEQGAISWTRFYSALTSA